MTDTQGCGWDGVHWSIDQLVADGSANARHELARRLRSVLARMQGGPPVSNDDKTDLTPERLEKLRALANAATPGPWTYRDRDASVTYNHSPVPLDTWTIAWPRRVGSGSAESNACFIAAANPATVLALVDEVERLRALLAACAKSPGYAACLRECKEDHQ